IGKTPPSALRGRGIRAQVALTERSVRSRSSYGNTRLSNASTAAQFSSAPPGFLFALRVDEPWMPVRGIYCWLSVLDVADRIALASASSSIVLAEVTKTGTFTLAAAASTIFLSLKYST